MKVGYASVGCYSNYVEILYTDGVFHLMTDTADYFGSYRNESELREAMLEALGCEDDYINGDIDDAIISAKQYTQEV